MLKLIGFLLFMIPFMKFYWSVSFFTLLMVSLLILFYLPSMSFNYLVLALGCDNLSFWMIMLSGLVIFLMLQASSSIVHNNYYVSVFLGVNLILLFTLVLVFMSLNLFIFYLFFEVSIVPTLLLILGWGYQPERLQAGIYMFFYTLVASLPMMISLFNIYFLSSSFDNFLFLNMFGGVLWFFCFNFIFLVKLPMFMVHLWLPKAHVEAPIAGSMILAGVMLKLGGYGLMRYMFMYIKFVQEWGNFLMSVSLLGGSLISLICLVQTDIKSLIAYSSVAHMGLVLAGLLSLNNFGYSGSLIIMIGHGLCSCGLFSLSNMMYERCYTRMIFFNKGMLNLIPSLSLWWFMFSIANMAAPPSINLGGEIMILMSAIGYSMYTCLFLIFISFFSACYCLYLYSITQHGVYSFLSFSSWVGLVREFYYLLLMLVPLNLLIINLDYFV
nr:NADH dehydrogenase subunit 4 [Microrhagus sp. ZM-2022]